MLSMAQGYYNGEYVVVNDEDKKELKKGDVFALVKINLEINEGTSLAEKRKTLFSSKKYTNKTGRSAEEIDAAIKEMRADDRV